MPTDEKREPVRIVQLTKTCDSCPSQWEGETDTGKKVYIRFRWGGLSIGVGNTLSEAVKDDLWYDDISDDLDGTLSESEMIAALDGVAEFDLQE